MVVVVVLLSAVPVFVCWAIDNEGAANKVPVIIIIIIIIISVSKVALFLNDDINWMLSYLRNWPSSLSPVLSSVLSVVMTDFAFKRFLALDDLLLILILEDYYWHNNANEVHFVNYCARRLCNDLCYFWCCKKSRLCANYHLFLQPPSGHTEARIYVFPIGWDSTSFIGEIWAGVNFTGSVTSGWKFRRIWIYDNVKIGIHFTLSIYLNAVYALFF